MQNKKNSRSHWAVLIGCIILMIFPGGVLPYTTGLFMYPICDEFGFSITAYSMVITLSSIVNALVSAFLVGFLSKGTKTTMKIIMAISVIDVCLGFAAQSLCTELWQFYLLAIVYNIGFNMITFVPVAMLVSNWFVKKRTLFTGIVMACSNLGGAIGNAVISQVITRSGWRTAYIGGGLISFIMAFFAVVFLIKRSPDEYGEQPYGVNEEDKSTENAAAAWSGITKAAALKQPAFYFLCIIMFLTGIYTTGVTNHVVTYFCMSGWDISAAGVVMTVFTLTGVIGSSLGGTLLEKLGYKKGIIYGGVMLLLAVISLILGNRNPVFAYLFAVLLGLSCYMGILLPSQAVMNTLGTRDYAALYGLTYSFYLVGSSIAVPAIAVISENAGYLAAWIGIAITILLIVALHLKCIQEGEKLRKHSDNFPA